MNKRVNNDFAIIVLAAGQSARLGQMKQLITLKEKSLVVVQLERALKVTEQVYCVLGFNASEVQDHIDHLPIHTIINRKWSDGMASSIAAGVKALAPEIKAVMIVLVDQWQVSSADLQRHQSYWRNNPAAIVVAQAVKTTASSASEKIGPPVIFPRCYFSQLTQLSGNQGAKPLLTKYQTELLKVSLVHGFIDIDTPEQLNTMNKILDVKIKNNTAK